MEYGHTLSVTIQRYVSQSLTNDCILIYLEEFNLFIHINVTVSNASIKCNRFHNNPGYTVCLKSVKWVV